MKNGDFPWQNVSSLEGRWPVSFCLSDPKDISSLFVLLEVFLHVQRNAGVVNMHADGAVSGKCDGAQFQSHLDTVGSIKRPCLIWRMVTLW